MTIRKSTYARHAGWPSSADERVQAGVLLEVVLVFFSIFGRLLPVSGFFGFFLFFCNILKYICINLYIKTRGTENYTYIIEVVIPIPLPTHDT
jgi:hypothetical protein